MKFPAFAYSAPETVSAALSLLAADENARPLAGGQSLLPLLALRLAAPGLLVDLGRIGALRTVEVHAGVVRIGAMMTHARNAADPTVRAHLPLLAEAVRHVAHDAVRNRGTIGGSLAHADAAAEMPVVAVALDATMVIAGPKGTRTIPAAEFFQGHYTTAIQPGELLTRIDVPASQGTWAFEEVARRAGDFALAMAAVGVRLDAGRIRSARIVLGGVSDRPVRATVAEAHLTGKALDAALAAEAGRLATSHFTPRGDAHISAEYRRSVASTAVRRALVRLASGTTS